MASMIFQVNQAGWDRVLRLLLGVLMLLLGGLAVLPEPWNLALVVFASYPVITGVTGWDPVYVMLGHRTGGR